jgi:hypothetical protein
MGLLNEYGQDATYFREISLQVLYLSDDKNHRKIRTKTMSDCTFVFYPCVSCSTEHLTSQLCSPWTDVDFDVHHSISSSTSLQAPITPGTLSKSTHKHKSQKKRWAPIWYKNISTLLAWTTQTMADPVAVTRAVARQYAWVWLWTVSFSCVSVVINGRDELAIAVYCSNEDGSDLYCLCTELTCLLRLMPISCRVATCHEKSWHVKNVATYKALALQKIGNIYVSRQH